MSMVNNVKESYIALHDVTLHYRVYIVHKNDTHLNWWLEINALKQGLSSAKVMGNQDVFGIT